MTGERREVIGDAIRAARLDPDFYNLIDADRSYTVRAAILVVVASAASGFGSALGIEDVSPWAGMLSHTVTGLIGWVMWSASAAFVGARFFGGITDFGEMLRVFGYAQLPRAIGIVPLLEPVGLGWAVVAAVVAVRQGQKLSTTQAVLVVFTGGVPAIGLTLAAMAFLRWQPIALPF